MESAVVRDESGAGEARAQEIAIEVEGVSKRYRRFSNRGEYTSLKSILLAKLLGRPLKTHGAFIEALRGVDLVVPKGKAVGLIGPNGSGKSTLLKLIAGILTPDEGTIRVGGRISPLIELGAGFHPEFSGRENIFLNGIVLGLSRAEIEERYQAIVDFAELHEFIDDPVRTYSSGMYMRLGFSIAIHASPDILLIDEILAVGDQAFSQKCEEWLGRFLADGNTVLLVTHSLPAIERWCSEVVWLENGKARMRGAADEVTRAYQESVGGVGPGQRSANGGQVGGALIEDARLTHSDGSGPVEVDSGDDLELEVSYRVGDPEVLQRLGVTVSVKRSDGVSCCGASTILDGVELPVVQGLAKVRCSFPSMRLKGGSYWFDVTLELPGGTQVDHRPGLAPFRMRDNLEELGIFRVDHDWVVP